MVDDRVKQMTRAALADLEASVVHAARTGETAAVNMIGYGEISVALGYPAVDPEVVAKRIAVCSPAEFDRYESAVSNYVARLTDQGVSVVSTRTMSANHGRDVAAYVLQPLLPAASIGHRVLAAAEPDPNHALVLAIAEVIVGVSHRLSVDAQVTNWSWDGEQATLIDVGTPFMWDTEGGLIVEVAPLTRLFPRPVRSYVGKELTELAARWKEPRAVATDLISNLYREGLDQWVGPFVETFNRELNHREPITADEAHRMYQKDRASLPMLKRLQKAERLWQTRVRRSTYDYIIVDSTY